MSAILVDLDGTLVETGTANFAAYAAAMSERGLSVTRSEFDALAQGRNWRQFLPQLIERRGSQADPAAIAARKAELYAGMLGDTIVNAALVRLLRLARSSCRLALVTTASAVNALAILRHHALVELFDTIVTGDDVTAHKPAPDAYALAAQRLGVTAGQSLVIEDSETGVASGRAFGAEVLRVAW